MTRIDNIDRPTDAMFLLFFYAREVKGVTKVQKLLFLIERETVFGELYGRQVSLDFQPYKMGPFSPDVYDEIEFLLNMDAIEQVEGVDSATDSFELNRFTNYEEGSEGLSGKTFVITEKGDKIGTELESAIDEQVATDLRETVRKYNSMSLMELLEYVYSEYPQMTEESEIKDEVLGYNN